MKKTTSTKRSVVLYAPNVHSGGGKVLLDSLLNDFPEELSPVLVLDSRYHPITATAEKIRSATTIAIKNTFFNRLKAELSLRALSKDAKWVFCFGNLPPLFRLTCPVYVFFQNRNLLNEAELNGFGLFSRLKHNLERQWLRLRRKNATIFLVQTRSVARSLTQDLSESTTVRVMPFVPNEFFEPFLREAVPTHDFVYVSSGEPHKNHRNLVLAWKLLAAEEIFPSLCLTLNEKTNQDLVSWINNQKTEYSLQISNRTSLTRTEIWNLLAQGRALIFPSLRESFGLPLLEASRMNLPILAPELDYVRDLVLPSETFDPTSPTSIAKAVKRFLRLSEPSPGLLTPRNFINQLSGLSEEAK